MYIIHDEKNQKFITTQNGQEGFLEYEMIGDNTIDFTHTFVPESLRNQGVASKIVEYALNYANTHNLKIIPSCPFVRSYMERHASI